MMCDRHDYIHRNPGSLLAFSEPPAVVIGITGANGLGLIRSLAREGITIITRDGNGTHWIEFERVEASQTCSVIATRGAAAHG